MVPLAILLLATSALATDFNKCDSGPAPRDVRVRDCSAQPCTFSPGHQVHVEVDFDVDHTISALTPDVKATVFGLTVDYPIEKDGCKSLQEASCPLQDGETDTYILEMQIPDIEVESPVKLEFTMTDQEDKVLICFDLDGQVVIDSK